MSDAELATLRRQADEGDTLAALRLRAAEGRLDPADRPAVKLRPYQEGAIEAFLAGAKRGLRRMLVVLPTGTGKTVLGISLARRLEARTLWLAHREELIRQPLATAAHVWPEASRGVVKASDNDHAERFVVASTPTLWRPNRVRDLKAGPPFDLVVADEVHHFASEQNVKLLEELGAFTEGGPLFLGITATPTRTDRKALDMFEETVFKLGLLEAIDQGYLAPFTSRQIKIDFKAENVGLTKAGDFKEEELARELLRAGAAEATARAVAEHAGERKTIVFTVSVEQAERTAGFLVALGIRSEAVSCYTPALERKAILARLHSGETQVVCNAMLLVEGFDEPAVACIAVARPTKSQPLYVQQIGRGLRLFPGKTDCLLLDLVGASDLGLVTAERMVRELQRELAGEPRRDSEGNLEVVPGSVEDERVAAYVAAASGEKRAASRVSWIEVATGECWALGAGEHGTFVLVRDTKPVKRGPWSDLRDDLAAGRAHLRGKNKNFCPWPLVPGVEPERLGWRKTAGPFAEGNGGYAAQGPCVGRVHPAMNPLGANVFLEDGRVVFLDEILAPDAALEDDAESWRAELLPKDGAGVVIGDRGDLTWVMGLAEERARALRVLKLSAQGAGWRILAATDGQRQDLDRGRIAYGADLTRGEASDLITASVVRFRVLGRKS